MVGTTAMSSDYYTIIVQNMSASTQYFFVFQQQATFTPAVASSSIYSCTLGCQAVGNYDSTGAVINFQMGAEIYAGAISTAPPPSPSECEAMVATASTDVVRSIQLATSSSSSALDCTTLTINPLGMSSPVNQSGIATGAFAVKVPSYTPAPSPELYCGLATINGDGTVLLSSYIAPTPNATMSCKPAQIFYVAIGYEEEGSVIAYDTSNAACCDFTTGYTLITVTYNPDGTFSTQNGS